MPNPTPISVIKPSRVKKANDSAEDNNSKAIQEVFGVGVDSINDANTFSTMTTGISGAGQRVALAASKSISYQSYIHMALTAITLPLALYNLWEQYKSLKELKEKTVEEPNNKQENYRTPRVVNEEMVSLKKKQLASSATNVLVSLAFTSVVVATIFTGGLALGVVGVTALAVGTAKMGMDLYLEEKEKKLSIELFESKVLNKMDEDELKTYKKLTNSTEKTLYIAKKALSLSDAGYKNFSEDDIKDYLLKKRQGYFENAKMRNAQLVFGAIGMGLWTAFSFVTGGLAGVVALGVVTAMSSVLSVVSTEKVQSALGPKVTEWFRTIFSSKNGADTKSLDFKNSNIDSSFFETLRKTDAVNDIADKSNSSYANMINKLDIQFESSRSRKHALDIQHGDRPAVTVRASWGHVDKFQTGTGPVEEPAVSHNNFIGHNNLCFLSI